MPASEASDLYYPESTERLEMRIIYGDKIAARLSWAVLLCFAVVLVSCGKSGMSAGKNMHGSLPDSAVDVTSRAALEFPSAFATEKELIRALADHRSKPIELVGFDASHKVSPSIGVATMYDSAKGAVRLTGSPGAGGSFIAVLYDSSRWSYTGLADDSTGAVSTAIHPFAGVVVWGAAAVKGAASRLSAVLDFAPGKETAIRELSAAPRGTENSVSDLAVTDGGADWQLSWTEKNVGDYTNDGEVAISDITPIALNFLATVNHANPADHAAIVDGDGSNEVSISDITPIALHYLNFVAGYQVMRFVAGGSWTAAGTVPRVSGMPTPAWLAAAYSKADAKPASADTYYVVRPYDAANAFGMSSSVVGVPGSNPGLKPPPPVDIPPADNTVNLAVSGVQNFEIPAGVTQTFDVALGSADANYTIALTSFGTASNTPSTVVVARPLSGTSSLAPISPPLELPAGMSLEPNKLTLALEKQADYVLKNGSRPAEVLRTPSAIGDHHTFNIVFGDPLFDLSTVDGTVDGVLRGESTACRVWVDSQADDGRITNAQAQEIADNVKNKTRSKEAATYGDIYDIDADGKFDVLLTPWINAIPGKIRGLFVTNDLQAVTGSNSMDLVYLEVPDAQDPANEGDPLVAIPPGFFDAATPITLSDFSNNYNQESAHEMQHLINFSNRLRIRDRDTVSVTNEAVWLNESLSHFTEDFVGYQGQANLTGASQFLESCYTIPLVSPAGVDNPWIRGEGYLFMRYLYEQKGAGVFSKILLKDLPTTMYAGTANIDHAGGGDFKSLFQSWLATMAFVGWANTPAAAYRYQPPAANSVTGNLSGVTFFQPFTDYKSLDAYLGRPLTFRLGTAPLSVSLLPNTPLFVLVNDPMGGTVRVSIQAGANPVVGAFTRDANQAQAYEAGSGPTAFEFGKLFAGNIDSAADTDMYTVNLTQAGYMFLRAVANNPSGLTPKILVNGQTYSDVNSLPGVDLKVLLFPAGFGDANLEVSGEGVSTGSYLISAEYYPQ